MGEPADLYRSDELWQVPSTKGLAEAMQRAYQEGTQRDAKASLGLEVAYRFTPERVGQILLEAITNAAPEIGAENAMDQALAWNIGTTGMATSRLESAIASPSAHISPCSTLERWE